MKYPCETCLVDVMCTDVCSDLIFFSDDLVSYDIDPLLVKTEIRYNRIRKCVLSYGARFSSGRICRVDNGIVHQWNLLKEKNNERYT